MARQSGIARTIQFAVGALLLAGAGYGITAYLSDPGPEFIEGKVERIKFVHVSPFTDSGFRERYVYVFDDTKGINKAIELTNSMSDLSRKAKTVPKGCIATDKYALLYEYGGQKYDQKYDPILRCDGELYGPLSGDSLDEYFEKLEKLAEDGGYETTDQGSVRPSDTTPAPKTPTNTTTSLVVIEPIDPVLGG